MAYVGSILLALCGVPLAYSAWKKGYDDTNAGLLIMWTAGEVLLALSYWHDPALMLNYISNLLCVGVVWWVRWRKHVNRTEG